MPLDTVVGLDASDLVLDGNPAPPRKGAQQLPHSVHVYCSQTALWIKMKLGMYMYVGLGLRQIVLNGDPAPLPQRGTTPPQLSAHACCGQTAGWIKTPLGREVGLGPGDIVLDGEPAPLKKGHSSPHTFGPMSIVAEWLDGSRLHLVGR